ncbi:hypothetical protein T310_9175, partial [Rasamsonia emersonii CBS 393.64]
VTKGLHPGPCLLRLMLSMLLLYFRNIFWCLLGWLRLPCLRFSCHFARVVDVRCRVHTNTSVPTGASLLARSRRFSEGRGIHCRRCIHRSRQSRVVRGGSGGRTEVRSHCSEMKGKTCKKGETPAIRR